MGKPFRRVRRSQAKRPVPEQAPVKGEGGKAHVHVQVQIEFCIRSDPNRMREQVATDGQQVAYEQLLHACLRDPRTRIRVLLDQVAMTLEGVAEAEKTYELLSGDRPTPPAAGISLEEIVRPQVRPDGDYLYEGTEQEGEAGTVCVWPISNAFKCQVHHVRVTERFLPVE